MARLSSLYAAALFALCEESGGEALFLEQAVFLQEAFSEPETKRVLVHPHIPAAEKKAFFAKALEGKIHDGLFSFLSLTVDKNREVFFLPALSELAGLIERKQGKTKAKVTSAVGLNPKETAALKKLLEKKLDKQVEIIQKIDPSVIGGPYILADGYFIDSTVKHRLQELTAELKA